MPMFSKERSQENTSKLEGWCILLLRFCGIRRQSLAMKGLESLIDRLGVPRAFGRSAIVSPGLDRLGEKSPRCPRFPNILCSHELRSIVEGFLEPGDIVPRKESSLDGLISGKGKIFWVVQVMALILR